jgi:hypothetical protein
MVVLMSAALAAVVMPIALSQGASQAQAQHVKLTRAQQRQRAHLRGRRGARGPRGVRGFTGSAGATGALGPAGPSGGAVQVHNATVNWQNGPATQANSTTGFVIPGIGLGELVCNQISQQLQIYPLNKDDYVTVWYVREQTSSGGVYGPTLATDRFTPNHNQKALNEGFNKFTGPESTTAGSFHGIISDRGPGGITGPGPAPTTFHVSFTWDFTNQGAYRCYVAASFTTGA